MKHRGFPFTHCGGYWLHRDGGRGPRTGTGGGRQPDARVCSNRGGRVLPLAGSSAATTTDPTDVRQAVNIASTTRVASVLFIGTLNRSSLNSKSCRPICWGSVCCSKCPMHCIKAGSTETSWAQMSSSPKYLAATHAARTIDHSGFGTSGPVAGTLSMIAGRVRDSNRCVETDRLAGWVRNPDAGERYRHLHQVV